jgi:hypothetical protein
MPASRSQSAGKRRFLLVCCALNSLSLRGWFFDDMDAPRQLKGDYYTCSKMIPAALHAAISSFHSPFSHTHS